MSYVNINKEYDYNFCQIPRNILYDEPYKSNLSPLSKLGYSFILERLNLSKINNKVDMNGNIYIFFSQTELADKINISVRTAGTIFKELEECNLIKQQSQGNGKAYKIYVNDNVLIRNITPAKITEVPMQNLPTTPENISDLPLQNLQTNNIDKLYINNNISSIKEEKEILRQIKDKCLLNNFNTIKTENSMSMDIILSNIIEYMFYCKEFKYKSSLIPNETMREKLLLLNNNHLTKVVETYQNNYKNIINHQCYLSSCIYSAISGFEFNLNVSNNKTKYRYKDYEQRTYSDEELNQFYENNKWNKEEEEEMCL